MAMTGEARKPHQHQASSGERWDCNNRECRMPFKANEPRKNYLQRSLRKERQLASREEQHARYLDCGPQAWDDRE